MAFYGCVKGEAEAEEKRRRMLKKKEGSKSFWSIPLGVPIHLV
jgi:hypothetical protein